MSAPFAPAVVHSRRVDVPITTKDRLSKELRLYCPYSMASDFARRGSLEPNALPSADGQRTADFCGEFRANRGDSEACTCIVRGEVTFQLWVYTRAQFYKSTILLARLVDLYYCVARNHSVSRVLTVSFG